MANVTYLIGAGASAGKRRESGENKKHIIEGLPCVYEIPDRISNILDILKAKPVESTDKVNSQLKEENAVIKHELISCFQKLYDAVKKHATIDTYAKKLKLKGQMDEFRELEQLLTLFFLYEQIQLNPDSRYDTFLANILQNRSSFPKHINIISWNYDSQIEIAYSEYNDQNILNIGTKSDSYYQDWQIIKLNGTATFRAQFDLVKKREEIALKLQEADNDLVSPYTAKQLVYQAEFVSLYNEYVKDKEHTSNLSFAFDDSYPSDALLRRSQKIISETNALVIIGYTFPFFNREIDRKILRTIIPDTKIYIQDLYPERIKQSLRAVLPHIKEDNIILLKEVDQFYLPPEL